MDEHREELEEQLRQLHQEEDELSKVIISLSKFPNATEALLAAYSTMKENYMEILNQRKNNQ